jgi:hypothetical protein
MNPEQNPYISKQLNPYNARKEKNPYIKEEIPRENDLYHKKQEEISYRSKEEVKIFCPKREENPYLKKNDGSPSPVEKSYINEGLNEKNIIHINKYQKTKKQILDVKVTMNSL